VGWLRDRRVLLPGATDDAPELLVVTDLLARAARETDKEKLRRYGSFSRASAKLAAAVEVLLEATGFDEEISLEQESPEQQPDC
jgi:hypothetical protein